MKNILKKILVYIIGLSIPIIIAILVTLIIFAIGLGLFIVLDIIRTLAHNFYTLPCGDLNVNCLSYHGHNFFVRDIVNLIKKKPTGLDYILGYVVFLGLLFSISKLLLKILKKLAMGLLKFLKMILLIPIIFILRLFGSKKRYFPNFRIISLLKTYFSLLSPYLKGTQIGYIFKTHGFFLSNIFRLRKFPTEGKEYHQLSIPFEHRGLMEDLGSKSEKFAGNGVDIKGPFVFRNNYISYHLSENSLGSRDTVNKLLNNKDEILRVLPFYNHEEGSAFEMTIDVMKDDLRIKLFKKDIWKEQRKLDIFNTEIAEGELLLGFYPKITNTGIEYLKYLVKSSEFIHSFVAGTTRSGKDIFMNNFIYSILKNIEKYSSMSLYLFDTKGNDWEAFDSLEDYSVYRYKPDDYIKVLESLIEEMNKRYEKIGVYSKLSRYIEANPKEKNNMRETFIVINEVLDLFKKTDKKYVSTITSYLTEILSKGAGAGLHLVLLAQTMTKKMHPDVSLILANIKTRFGLKLGDMDQADIVGSGLSKIELERLRRIIQNNCMHIEDMKIIKEFKGYMIFQEELLDFVNKTFKPIKVFKEKRLNSYLAHILKTRSISLKEASSSPYSLSEKEWKDFIEYLLSKKIIRYENGVGYILGDSADLIVKQ